MRVRHYSYMLSADHYTVSAASCSHKLHTKNTEPPGRDDWAPFDSVMKLEILCVLESEGMKNDNCLQFLLPFSLLLSTEVAKRKQGRESEVVAN